MAVILRIIVQVENLGVDLVGVLEFSPKGLKGIDNKVCRDVALGKREVGIFMRGEEDTKESKDDIWIEVMV